MGVSVDKLVSVYIKMRDERDRIKRDMEAQIDSIEEQMKVISAELLDICKETGADSFRTPFGTAYRTLKERYWTNDWESFYHFMQEHNAFNLLEKRIHQGNTKLFLEENPDLLPMGLNIDKSYAVRVVRRK